MDANASEATTTQPSDDATVPAAPRLLYEVRVPAFQDGKDPRKAVASWVANAARSKKTNDAVSSFPDALRAAPEASLPAVTG